MSRSKAVFFLWLLSISTGASSEEKAEELTGILGESVTFQVKNSEPFSRIFWLSDKNKGNIAFATPNKGPEETCQLEVTASAFDGRLNASEDCKSLQVNKLRQNDSDRYTAQIPRSGGEKREIFSLKVYKRLLHSDLNISCNKSGLSGGNGSLWLTCSAGKWEEDVEFSWASDKKNESSGKSFLIQDYLQDSDWNFTCTAENPVSKASKTVSLKQDCNEHPSEIPVTVPSTENGEKVPPHPQTLGIWIGILIVGIIIIGSLGAVVYWKKRVAGRKHLGATSQAEPTLYDQIDSFPEAKTQPRRGPKAEKEKTHTIYTTVQHYPKQNPLLTDAEKLQKKRQETKEKSEKTIYSEITQPIESEDQQVKTVYETVKNLRPPEASEYNKIL